MTRDEAIKKLRANMWGGIVTPAGTVIQDMSKAFLMERDKDFPMDYFVVMISLQGREAFEIVKALSPDRKAIVTPSGETHFLPIDEDELDDGGNTKIVLQ